MNAIKTRLTRKDDELHATCDSCDWSEHANVRGAHTLEARAWIGRRRADHARDHESGGYFHRLNGWTPLPVVTS